MTAWGDVITRARGLSTHLLRAAQYAPLCAAEDVRALADQLSALRLMPAPERGAAGDEHAIELALRRRAGARLRILTRWAGDRRDELAPLLDDEDRRALRALLRGALAGVPPEARLSGLIPTPALPMRALDQLARAGNVATIAALLVAWRHPFGADLATEGRRQRPDPLELEMTLARTYARRARGAARSGDASMRLFVSRVIDLENLRAFVVLAEHRTDVDAASVFVTGGRIVTADDLRAAAQSASAAEASARLGRRTAGTPLAAALAPGNRPADDCALDALVREFHRFALREPLGTAPLILFVLQQRAELRNLLRVLWSISLGVPRAAIARAVGVAA